MDEETKRQIVKRFLDGESIRTITLSVNAGQNAFYDELETDDVLREEIKRLQDEAIPWDYNAPNVGADDIRLKPAALLTRGEVRDLQLACMKAEADNAALKKKIDAYEVALCGIPDSYADEVKRRVERRLTPPTGETE